MHLSFQGLGDDGRPCTASVSDVKMSLDVMKAGDERIDECDGLDVRIEKAGRLKKVSSALEKCGDIPSLVGHRNRRAWIWAYTATRKASRGAPP